MELKYCSLASSNLPTKIILGTISNHKIYPMQLSLGFNEPRNSTKLFKMFKRKYEDCRNQSLEFFVGLYLYFEKMYLSFEYSQ